MDPLWNIKLDVGYASPYCSEKYLIGGKVNIIDIAIWIEFR